MNKQQPLQSAKPTQQILKASSYNTGSDALFNILASQSKTMTDINTMVSVAPLPDESFVGIGGTKDKFTYYPTQYDSSDYELINNNTPIFQIK